MIRNADSKEQNTIPPRSWCRNPTSWISITSIIVGAASVAIALSAMHIAKNQYYASLRQELHEVCARILEIRNKEKILNADIGTEMSIYLYRAMVIESQIPKGVTPSEYVIMANEMGKNGDYTQQERFLKKAVNNSTKDSYEEVEAYRKLGWFYYWQSTSVPDPQKALAKARECFRFSIEVWGSDTEPFRKYYITGITYVTQGYWEACYVKDYEKAKQYNNAGFSLLNQFSDTVTVNKYKDEMISTMEEHLEMIVPEEDIDTKLKELFGEEEINAHKQRPKITKNMP